MSAAAIIALGSSAAIRGWSSRSGTAPADRSRRGPGGRVGCVKRLLRLDWDIIAGIVAAGAAIVLHLLHIVAVDVLLTIALVLLALLLLRDLRREGHDERTAVTVRETRTDVSELRRALAPPEAILIGPQLLQAESRRFAESAHGRMVWFNMCFAMFRSQEVFDLMLRPAIENPRVESIEFLSGHGERERWDRFMAPKITECSAAAKVQPPRWRDLPETVSFVLADFEPDGATEALLSFWGEPFMSRAHGTQAPRYVFRIAGHSDLIARFVEMEREHRRGED